MGGSIPWPSKLKIVLADIKPVLHCKLNINDVSTNSLIVYYLRELLYDGNLNIFHQKGWMGSAKAKQELTEPREIILEKRLSKPHKKT